MEKKAFAELKAERAKKSISKHYHESLYQELTWVKYLTGNRPHQEKIMGLHVDHEDEHQLYQRFRECFIRFPTSQKSYTLIKSIQKFKTIGIFCAEAMYMLIYVGVSGYVDQIPFRTPTDDHEKHSPRKRKKVNLFDQQVEQKQTSSGFCGCCCQTTNPNAIQRFDEELSEEKDDIYNLIDKIVNIYPFDPVLLVVTCMYMEELVKLLQEKLQHDVISPEKAKSKDYAFQQLPDEPSTMSFIIPDFGSSQLLQEFSDVEEEEENSFVVEQWHSIELYFLICFMLACKNYGLTSELPMDSSLYFEAFQLSPLVTIERYNTLERSIFMFIANKLHVSSNEFVNFLQKPEVHKIVQQQIEDDDSHSQLQLFTTSKVSQR
mmetsp:Transcript_863/g.1349  ORF Transcript_863/g.1349 Transcript_863/m.1349 type:complete len:376 (-) Transcript_863:998-2125(-)